MNINKQATISLGLAAVMTASACNQGKSVLRTVDGRSFNVPVTHLIEAAIPWFPSSQSAGFHFYINPNSKPEVRPIVTMESSSTTCNPSTPPVSDQLSTACAAAMRSETNYNERDFPLVKVYLDDGRTQWEYRTTEPSAGNDDHTVASCYALTDGLSGSCTAISHYGKLVYSLRFSDAEIASLSRMQAKVRDLLASWEQRS